MRIWEDLEPLVENIGSGTQMLLIPLMGWKADYSEMCRYDSYLPSSGVERIVMRDQSLMPRMTAALTTCQRTSVLRCIGHNVK